MPQGNIDPKFGSERATFARTGPHTYAIATSASEVLIDLEALGLQDKWITMSAETEGVGYLFRNSDGTEVPSIAARDTFDGAGAVSARGTGVCGFIPAGESRDGYVHGNFPVLVVIAGAAGVLRFHNSQANPED